MDICYEHICDKTLSFIYTCLFLLSLRVLESWGVHWFIYVVSYGLYQVMLYRVITKLFHIFSLFGYGVFWSGWKNLCWIFYDHIGDQTLSFILHLSFIIFKTEIRFSFGQDFIKFKKRRKKKEFYIKFESPCRFYAKYFLLSMFV